VRGFESPQVSCAKTFGKVSGPVNNQQATWLGGRPNKP
jgi:hypothetical protein